MNRFVYEIYELDEKGNKSTLVAEEITARARDLVLRYYKRNNPGKKYQVDKLTLI